MEDVPFNWKITGYNREGCNPGPRSGTWGRRSAFLRRVVIEADDAGDLPSVTFLPLPQGNELRFSYIAGVSGVVEAVDSDLDGSVISNGINLEGPGNEFSGYFSADVVLYSVEEHLTADGQTRLVVIELKVFGNE